MRYTYLYSGLLRNKCFYKFCKPYKQSFILIIENKQLYNNLVEKFAF